MPKSSPTRNSSWFGSRESLLVVSSIGGSIATLVFQQIAFAAATSISLSLAVGLNSSNNRRRLDEVSQHHQAFISGLGQQYSKEREFLNEVIRHLPTRSEQVEIENHLTRLEAHNNKITSRVEGQVQHLERQIHNSLLPDLQTQFVEVVQLVEQLQKNTIDSSKFHQHLSNEIQSLHKQFQALVSSESHITLQKDADLNSIRKDIKFIYELLGDIQGQNRSPTELTDNFLLLDLQHQLAQAQLLSNQLKASNEHSNQLTQNLAGEIVPLQKQVQSISINLFKKIEKVQSELQNRLIILEEADCKIRNDISNLSISYTKLAKESEPLIILESPPLPQYNCEHCRRTSKNKPLQGGHFRNSKFCSSDCRYQYENMNGLL